MCDACAARPDAWRGAAIVYCCSASPSRVPSVPLQRSGAAGERLFGALSISRFVTACVSRCTMEHGNGRLTAGVVADFSFCIREYVVTSLLATFNAPEVVNKVGGTHTLTHTYMCTVSYPLSDCKVELVHLDLRTEP